MTVYYQRGPVTIYHGDCLAVLPTLSGVDAVVTDPPYGVGFQYESFVDDDENFQSAVRPAVLQCIERFPAVCVCMSFRRMWEFPAARWALCWAKPGSVRRNRCGGFSEWEPVLVYGQCRFFNDFRYLPDCVNHSDQGIEHPCPKPVRLFEWLCEGVGEGTILDPFLGSGTTAVACIRTGRSCIGIELEEKYCEIAAKRCDRELDQGRLFEPERVRETQRELCLTGLEGSA